MDTKCGLHKSPWVLQAKKGQQIEVGLIDFSWMNSSDNCNSIYGYMLDTKDDIINICGGGQRQRHLYLSEGNILQISMHESALEQHRFLLSFKGIIGKCVKIYIISFIRVKTLHCKLQGINEQLSSFPHRARI